MKTSAETAAVEINVDWLPKLTHKVPATMLASRAQILSQLV